MGFMTPFCSSCCFLWATSIILIKAWSKWIDGGAKGIAFVWARITSYLVVAQDSTCWEVLAPTRWDSSCVLEGLKRLIMVELLGSLDLGKMRVGKLFSNQDFFIICFLSVIHTCSCCSCQIFLFLFSNNMYKNNNVYSSKGAWHTFGCAPHLLPNLCPPTVKKCVELTFF
jgi:hypothetical protein